MTLGLDQKGDRASTWLSLEHSQLPSYEEAVPLRETTGCCHTWPGPSQWLSSPPVCK